MKNLLTAFFVLLAGTASSQVYNSRIKAPENTAFRDNGTLVLHGDTLQDNYQRMQKMDTSFDSWVKAQAAHATTVLGSISGRDSLAARIHELNRSVALRTGLPTRLNEKLIYDVYDVERDKDLLMLRSSLSAKDSLLLDLTDFNTDSSAYYLSFFQPSFDGKYIALGMTPFDTELATVMIYDVEKNQTIDSVYENSDNRIAWAPDSKGFYYARHGGNKENYFADESIMYHRLLTDTCQDKTVFSRKNNPELHLKETETPIVEVFPTAEDQVFISIIDGTAFELKVYTCSAEDIKGDRKKWKKLLDYTEGAQKYTANNKQVYFITYKDTQTGKLMSRPWNKKEKAKIVYQAQGHILKEIQQTRSGIYISYTIDGLYHLLEVDKQNQANEIALPYHGYLSITRNDNTYRDTEGVFMVLSTWNKDATIYYCEPGSKKAILTDIRPQGAMSQPKNIVVKEIMVASYDSVMVPLSIFYDSTLIGKANNPVILSSYGAYGFSMDATFDYPNLAFLEQGGIYAVAHIRGGGEKGEAWHQAALKATKQNSWKDIIACAEYLKSHGYSDKINLYTGSAGGVPTGRALTERPELFTSAVISVGVMNPLLFEMTSNKGNVPEFGTVKNKAGYKALLKMDPYMHLKKGVKYPPMLLTAAVNDERVQMWQIAKFVAKAQDLGNEITLLRVDFENGHFTNNYSAYELEMADYFAFILWQSNKPSYRLVLK